MTKENIPFPELDARIAEFMDDERADGNEPKVIHDMTEGAIMKYRTVCVLSNRGMTEFTQFRYSDGGYDPVSENWISPWHVRLLLSHLEKEDSTNEGESGR